MTIEQLKPWVVGAAVIVGLGIAWKFASAQSATNQAQQELSAQATATQAVVQGQLASSILAQAYPFAGSPLGVGNVQLVPITPSQGASGTVPVFIAPAFGAAGSSTNSNQVPAGGEGSG